MYVYVQNKDRRKMCHFKINCVNMEVNDVHTDVLLNGYFSREYMINIPAANLLFTGETTII